MKKIILLFSLLMIYTNVYAYENKYFKIDIQETYKLEKEKNNNYKWTNNKDYISISINKNKNKNDIKKYTQKDIFDHKKYLLSNYKKSLNDDIEITNIQISNKNNIYYIEYYLTINTKKTTGSDTYQYGRIYASDNYIYTLLMSSNKEIKDVSVFNTFNYKDSYPKKLNIKEYLFLLAILLLVILLLDYLISKKHK